MTAYNVILERKKIVRKIASLLLLIILMLITSTAVYCFLEGWDWIDSLYFSTVTISTVGYGDMHPTTKISKLFTVFFILSGVAMMAYALSILGTYYINYLESHQKTFSEAINHITKKEPEKWYHIKMKKKHEEYEPSEKELKYGFKEIE